jgi:hypothetical protein|tara:strand:- start:1070 stop:1267 length:198 start_codon:yes stop_codon:yes gene_type:complete
MMVIDRIIKDLEEKSVEYSVAGDNELAKRSRLLASKYREMKYNGHVTVYEEKDERDITKGSDDIR